jgi:hypothetical protein
MGEIGGLRGVTMLTATGSGSQDWVKVGEVTLTEEANSITFSELDLNTDQVYILFLHTKLSASTDICLVINGDTTVTNYYMQRFIANNTSVAGLRNSSNTMLGAVANYCSSITGFIQFDLDGNVQYSGFGQENAPASITLRNQYVRHNSVEENVTSVGVKVSGEYNFPVGTRFLLCRPR